MSPAALALCSFLAGLDLELPAPAPPGIRAGLEAWAPLLEIAGARSATLRLEATARGYEGPMTVTLGSGTALLTLLRGGRPAPFASAAFATPRSAVFVAVQLPEGLDRLAFLGTGGALGKLAGLDPVRHLGWAGDEMFLRLDDFSPPAELVPSLFLGIRAPDPAAAAGGLSALGASLEELWGVRYVPRHDGGLERHEAEVAWLVDCQPAWALHDGWAWIAYDGRRLGRPTPAPATGPAPAGTFYLRVEGAALRSLNAHLTAVETAGRAAHRETPLESALGRLEVTLSPSPEGLAGRVLLALERR